MSQGSITWEQRVTALCAHNLLCLARSVCLCCSAWIHRSLEDMVPLQSSSLAGDAALIPAGSEAQLCCGAAAGTSSRKSHIPQAAQLKKSPRATPLVTQQGQHCHRVTSRHRHHLLDIQKEDLSKIRYIPVPVTASVQFLGVKTLGKI